MVCISGAPHGCRNLSVYLRRLTAGHRRCTQNEMYMEPVLLLEDAVQVRI